MTRVSSAPDSGEIFEAQPVHSLYEFESLTRRYPQLHFRYSGGPSEDAQRPNIDVESGLHLPGLAVHPLQPEEWWHRPVSDWLVRQLYHHGRSQKGNLASYAWTLTGRSVGRGANCEPLLSNVLPVARLSDHLLEEAQARYRENFNVDESPDSDL
ncbi:MAG: DUF6098 family protein [Leucobacter sp.]